MLANFSMSFRSKLILKMTTVPLKYMNVVGLAEDELRELPLNFVKGCLRLDTS